MKDTTQRDTGNILVYDNLSVGCSLCIYQPFQFYPIIILYIPKCTEAISRHIYLAEMENGILATCCCCCFFLIYLKDVLSCAYVYTYSLEEASNGDLVGFKLLSGV